MWNRALLVLAAAALASCRQQADEPRFPGPQREVAQIIGDSFSTEDVRDRVGEATEVIALAGIEPGMWVADVGAGEGYYTVRLAPVVGEEGRVLSQDIVPETIERLAIRVQRERLDNVAVRLGTAVDPRLPARSFDRILLMHMYHEVASPYEFLWRLREGLKPGGEIIVVDADRPIRRHGMPPDLLKCEFEAVGLDLHRMVQITGGDAYFASFRAERPRPEPNEIQPCKG